MCIAAVAAALVGLDHGALDAGQRVDLLFRAGQAAGPDHDLPGPRVEAHVDAFGGKPDRGSDQGDGGHQRETGARPVPRSGIRHRHPEQQERRGHQSRTQQQWPVQQHQFFGSVSNHSHAAHNAVPDGINMARRSRPARPAQRTRPAGRAAGFRRPARRSAR